MIYHYLIVLSLLNFTYTELYIPLYSELYIRGILVILTYHHLVVVVFSYNELYYHLAIVSDRSKYIFLETMEHKLGGAARIHFWRTAKHFTLLTEWRETPHTGQYQVKVKLNSLYLLDVFVCPSVYLYILSVCLSICLSVCLNTCLSVYLYERKREISLFQPCRCGLSKCAYARVYVCAYASVCVCVPARVYVCVSAPVCVCV